MAVSGADIVAVASKELGDPYVFGATGPRSFDCSGLVQYVFAREGIKTPRIAADQARFGKAVSRSQLRPGDLIAFSWDGSGRADHIGIYAGNGEMIHAPHTGTVVKRVKLTDYYWSNAIAFRRFPGVTGGPATGEPGPGSDPVTAAEQLAPGLTGALRGIAQGAAGIAQGAASVGRMADLVTRLFLPSTMLRAASGALGTIFLIIGIWFLSREIRG